MTGTRISLNDLMPMAEGSGVMTAQGYLAIPARISRTGVQDYLAIEFGQTFSDREWDDVIKVYRPPAEVFDAASLASFNRLPVTNEHPFEDVTAGNWKEHAVGNTEGSATQDQTFVKTNLLVTDAGAVNDIQRGKRELSCGYSFMADMTPGTTPDGEPYDLMQTEIRGNHIAIVDAARCGEGCRAGDRAKSPALKLKLKDSCKCASAHPEPDQSKDVKMNLRTITYNDLPVEVNDAAYHVIDKAKSDMDKLKDENEALKKELSDLKAKSSKDTEEAEKEAGAKDAEIAKLKDAATKAPDIDAMVAERQALLDTAGTHLPKDFEFKGKDNAAIKRAVAATRVGDDALKDKPDTYVEGIFAAMAKDDAQPAPSRSQPDPFVSNDTNNQRPLVDNNNGYDTRDRALENAWKN